MKHTFYANAKQNKLIKKKLQCSGSSNFKVSLQCKSNPDPRKGQPTVLAKKRLSYGVSTGEKIWENLALFHYL